jgi:hypothetical protein
MWGTGDALQVLKITLGNARKRRIVSERERDCRDRLPERFKESFSYLQPLTSPILLSVLPRSSQMVGPCQATLEPGGRLTTGWPTIHPKAGPDAGLVAEPQSGLAVALSL